MQRIVFLLSYPFIWILSKLPLGVLHIISDCIYLLLFYFIGYRKKVVLDNLKLTFPNKKINELKKIRRTSYRHFVDIFIETIKAFGISEKEINERYKYINKEIFRDIEALNKSVILIGSHYANWEWLINLQNMTSIQCIGAYKQLSNPYFNKLIKKNRSRFGFKMVPTSKTIKKLLENKKKNIISLYGLLSDQSPQLHKTHYWGPFFNIVVPIHTGAEMLAKKHDFCVIYMNVEKIKRSRYEIEFEILSENPSKTPDYQITDAFLERTEKQIKKNPEYYFWTHNRFKHKDKAPLKSSKKVKIGNN